jgi:hypothetical protein
MAQSRSRPLWLAVALGLAAVSGAVLIRASNGTQGAELKPTSAVELTLAAPGAAQVDRFHPDLQPGQDGNRPPLPEPALGGSLTIQQTTKLGRLCSALDNTAGSAAILSVVHDALMVLDP